ncbi:MAG TPA: hypothetical protein ENI23_12010 [bacterium]|nr:hypothetical protein [bacterium]
MKKINLTDISTTLISILLIILVIFTVGKVSNLFQKPVDNDKDGFSQNARKNIDCDDNNPNIHPEAEDIAGDGIDQDCDGNDAKLDITIEDIEVVEMSVRLIFFIYG